MIMIDMEMPKKCQWDCLFCVGDGGACLVADVETSDTDRPKDCPLLPTEPCESRSSHCQKPTFEGMTNGEVLKKLFPQMEVWGEEKKIIFFELDKGTFRYGIFKDWWNAPYKESEEK